MRFEVRAHFTDPAKGTSVVFLGWGEHGLKVKTAKVSERDCGFPVKEWTEFTHTAEHLVEVLKAIEDDPNLVRVVLLPHTQGE